MTEDRKAYLLNGYIIRDIYSEEEWANYVRFMKLYQKKREQVRKEVIANEKRILFGDGS